jgi:hypothetical protein
MDPLKLSAQELLQLCLGSYVKAGLRRLLRHFQAGSSLELSRYQDAYPATLSNSLQAQSKFLIGSRLIQSGITEPGIARLWPH